MYGEVQRVLQERISGTDMFEKFGELTLDEFNKTAQGLRDEKDFESLKNLAKEYYIDEFDLEDYIAGDVTELATRITFALGKLQAEYKNEVKVSKKPWTLLPFKTVYDMSLTVIEDIADGISNNKNKKLKDIIDEMQKTAKKQATGNAAVCMCGTDTQLKNIIKAYYQKGIKAAAKEIDKIGAV